MPTTNIKQEAHRLIEQLPENTTWDDLMYEIHVPQAIEARLADSDADRTLDVKEVRTLHARRRCHLVAT
jgi:hypothetical protein